MCMRMVVHLDMNVLKDMNVNADTNEMQMQHENVKLKVNGTGKVNSKVHGRNMGSISCKL